MKCTIPEISWHNREPVLSVDIHPVSKDCYKLASGGGDTHVLVSHIKYRNKHLCIFFLDLADDY